MLIAPLSAATALPAVLVEDEMPQFPGYEMFAQIQPFVDDDGPADPRPVGEAEEIPVGLPGAEPAFPIGRRMPTTLYVVVITTINSFQCFALIQLLTSGGPVYSTSTVMRRPRK